MRINRMRRNGKFVKLLSVEAEPDTLGISRYNYEFCSVIFSRVNYKF